jgi:hypothetical protein
MAVILNIVAFDITAQMNCQVSPVSHILGVIPSDQLYSQALDQVWTRERLLLSSFMRLGLNFISLVIFLPCLCYLFAFDYASCVCLPCIAIISPKKGA